MGKRPARKSSKIGKRPARKSSKMGKRPARKTKGKGPVTSVKVNGKTQWYVEKIVGKRTTKKGVLQYEVKWWGWEDKDNSWEPRENLLVDCPFKVEEFEREERGLEAAKEQVAAQETDEKKDEQQRHEEDPVACPIPMDVDEGTSSDQNPATDTEAACETVEVEIEKEHETRQYEDFDSPPTVAKEKARMDDDEVAIITKVDGKTAEQEDQQHQEEDLDPGPPTVAESSTLDDGICTAVAGSRENADEENSQCGTFCDDAVRNESTPELEAVEVTLPVGINGGRNLEPEVILGMTTYEGVQYFLVKWKDRAEADFVPRNEANIKCPSLVIDFYEEHIVWGNYLNGEHPDMNKENRQ